jgi:hypothetical protein
MREIRTRLTYANVVASLALFVALGGTSYAAVQLARDSVRSKHIKNGEVGRPDLARSAVDSAKVKNGSLLEEDFAAAQLPAGAQGPAGPQGPAAGQGPPGPQGDTGAQGSQGATGAPGAMGSPGATGAQGSQGATGSQGAMGSLGATGAMGSQGATGAQGSQGATGPRGPSDVYEVTGNAVLAAANASRSLTLSTLPAGSYVAWAAATVGPTGATSDNVTAQCTLKASGVNPTHQVYARIPDGFFNHLNLQTTGTLATTGGVTLTCETNSSWTAGPWRISAVRVDSRTATTAPIS